MAKLQGKDLIVFYRTGDEYTTLAYATQCELDISAETMEVSSPDTGRWRTYRKRRLSWSLKNAKLVSRLSEGDLAQAIASSARVRVVIGSVAHTNEEREVEDYLPTGDMGYVGNAYLTRGTITGNNGDICTLSLELTGDGPLRSIRQHSQLIDNNDSPVFDSDGNAYCVLDIDLDSDYDPADPGGGGGGGGGGGDTYTKAQIDAMMAQKQNVLTFDTTPTQNSTNPVTSGGLYNVLGDISSALTAILS